MNGLRSLTLGMVWVTLISCLAVNRAQAQATAPAAPAQEQAQKPAAPPED